MTTKKLLTLKALMIVVLQQISAQQSITACGGDVSGSSGSVSYSYGQIDYINYENSSAKISEGVQQPYEILTISVEESVIDLDVNIYPNPTFNKIIISNTLAEFTGLKYSLCDLSGRIITQADILQNYQEIEMSEKSSGIYLLTMSSKNNVIKTFKITKK